MVSLNFDNKWTKTKILSGFGNLKPIWLILEIKISDSLWVWIFQEGDAAMWLKYTPMIFKYICVVKSTISFDCRVPLRILMSLILSKQLWMEQIRMQMVCIGNPPLSPVAALFNWAFGEGEVYLIPVEMHNRCQKIGRNRLQLIFSVLFTHGNLQN